MFPPGAVGVDTRYRLLRGLNINVYMGSEDSSDYIDPKIIHQIFDLVEHGVWLRIHNYTTEVDLVEASCKYHGIEIPESMNFIGPMSCWDSSLV